MKDYTPKELAELCAKTPPIDRHGNPGKIGYCDTAVGVFDPIAGRWIACFEKTIMPEMPWIRTNGQEYLVNGKHLERNWTAVEPAATPPAPIQPYKLALVETRRGCAMLEKEPRFDVILNGKTFEQLHFNTRGYVGTLPTPDGRQLSIGERPIAEYRKEVKRLNQEARAALVIAQEV